MSDWILTVVFIDNGGFYERVTELTRCKDCLWHYGTICRRNNTMFWNDDDFCSEAEREEYETD